MNTRSKILISVLASLITCLILIGSNSSLLAAADENITDLLTKAINRWGDERQSEEQRQELLQQWENGLQRFTDAEEEHGSAYHYTQSHFSVFGFGNRTTIWVKNNEFVRRYYEEFDDYPGPGVEPDYTYNETSDEVGTHSQGARPATMYDIYDECNALLQSDLEAYEIWFTADEDGIITSCGRYPYGCMDDCSDNARVSEFSFD